MIVLDTNVVSEIAHDRPHENVAKWIARQDDFELFICIPVVAELAFGANRVLLRDRSAKFMIALDDLINVGFRNRILPNDVASARKYGELFAKRQGLGKPIGPMDAMIGAICLVHGATLATRNVRDFEGIGLKLVNPFEEST